MQHVMFALALSAAVAQTPAQFAGEWTAVHKGNTFVRLEFQETGGALRGRISLADFRGDKDGVVDEVLSPLKEFTPIFDVAIRDGVLSFARKDGPDTDRFELRLAGDALMLRMIIPPELAGELARDSIPQPAPIRLTRAGR